MEKKWIFLKATQYDEAKPLVNQYTSKENLYADLDCWEKYQ